jgi:UDP-N-acetylglucosamine--N-acetylmuramyl-(pentapeptide) pyrophosphoryl-undecaprenol N-acetylglucosamine transferase
LLPGLSIAQSLQERLPQVSILFAGTGRPVERHMVRSAGFNYVALPCKPSPQNPLEALRFVTDNVAGFWAARWMLREQKAGLVVGLGGWASAAVVRAAVGRGIPTLLMEPNAVPSRTTRWLATQTDAVCTAFDEVGPRLHPQANVLCTGTPVRPQFAKLWNDAVAQGQRPGSRERRERRLVILGGSGGAFTLNRVMPHVARLLRDELAGWRIVHQTGEGQLQATADRYADQQVDALTVSYIDELASLLFESDLVVCRAAGQTLSEVALSGTPAVVVPFPESTDNHQHANADVYQRAGACTLIDEVRAGDRLADEIAAQLRLLMADGRRRDQMADAMRTLARPDAASSIADRCCEILLGSSSRLAA